MKTSTLRQTRRMMASTRIILLLSMVCHVACLIPLIDGGNKMPKMFECYFNDQIAKQASTAVSKAITAGKKNIEVQFPPVPNLDEVRFGTPLNKKFGTDVVAKDLKVVGGYKPGSDVSRYLVSYSNVYWAKKIASATSGGILGGKPVCVLTAEQISFNTVKNLGDLSRSGKLMTQESRAAGRNGEAVIAINPGGEETWNRIVSAHGSPGAPFVVLNNAYSTTYGLGNQCNFEEAYYLKRISKGWVFRAFPGKWEAYLEKPDGSVELLKSYKEKPELREVSALVRDESFKRFAINNDRFSKGFGERL